MADSFQRFPIFVFCKFDDWGLLFVFLGGFCQNFLTEYLAQIFSVLGHVVRVA